MKDLINWANSHSDPEKRKEAQDYCKEIMEKRKGMEVEDFRMYTNKEEYLLGEYYKCRLDYETKLEEIEQLQKDIKELKKRENELYNNMREYAYCTLTKDNKEGTLHKNKLTFHEDYIAIDDATTGSRILINKSDEDIPTFLKRNSEFIKSIHEIFRLGEIELVDVRDENKLTELLSRLNKLKI